MRLATRGIDPDDFCIEMLTFKEGGKGRLDSKGYHRVWRQGRYVQLHRLVAEPQPEPGDVIDHLCRNKRCIRVDHLEAVTNAENVRRGIVATRLREEPCVKCGSTEVVECRRNNRPAPMRRCAPCNRAYHRTRQATPEYRAYNRERMRRP